MLPDLLCRFVRDAFTLAHCTDHPDGNLFEEAIVELSHLLGFANHQGPGTLNLFGTRSASGNRHELDLGIQAPGMVGVAEAKSRAGGVSKTDVMIFVQKTFDFYMARLRERATGPTWRFFISATPVADPIRVYCIQQGVILIDPLVLPLPTLLRFVGQPEAEQVFDDGRLSEACRLFEPACLPMEEIFVPRRDRLELDPRRFFTSDASDARWLATNMTEDRMRSLSVRGRDPFRERSEVLARAGTPALHSLLRPALRRSA